MSDVLIKWASIICILFVILMGVTVAATTIGPAKISPDKVLFIILSKFPLIGDKITKTWTPGEETIIIVVRLPRVFLGILVGASLALAGATTQAIFKNPMADPYILGISSGAAFGAATVIVLGSSLFGTAAIMLAGLKIELLSIGIPIGSFIGAIMTTFIVFNIARSGNKVPVETLLLSGIAVSAFFSAVTSFLMYIAGRSLHQIVYWVMGALWSSSWNDVFILGPIAIMAALIIFAYSRDLNILLLGDEAATHLGTDVGKLKIFMLALSSIIAAIAVSVSGIIGFVGLIIPHMMRLVVGPDHRILIPSSILVGAIFLTSADVFSRIIIQPTEIPVGVITALIGAPFFIYLLVKKKKSII
jgi:iron complex transport system permease protein